jgi:hypothetical protein
MVQKKDLYKGCKVHYKYNALATPENGMIKEVMEDNDEEVRVVFHCDNQWSNIDNYTAQLTGLRYLYEGWV